MSTVHIPEKLAERLAAEASRRGMSVNELASQALSARFPDARSDASAEALEAFIGSGASGNREPFDIHKARDELAEHKLAEGA